MFTTTTDPKNKYKEFSFKYSDFNFQQVILASKCTLRDKMLLKSFQTDLRFISKGTFSYSLKIKVYGSKHSKNFHNNHNARLRLKKRYIYVIYEIDQC